MKKTSLLNKIIIGIFGFVSLAFISAHIASKHARKTTYVATSVSPIKPRDMGFYEKYIKRILDILCSFGAIVCFAPLYIIIAILVRIRLGSPILFRQYRPGLIDESGRESIFCMYKFRTMTDRRDNDGRLLPDEYRLTNFGRLLRKTSLDELPEAINILGGSMSVVGPRPQLVRDMIFMSDEDRSRHTAKPGLSGLAQISGRNAISWDDRLQLDREYIQKVNFLEDVRIVVETVKKAFIKREGIAQEDMATSEDYGDYLLRIDRISKDAYEHGQSKARDIVAHTAC